MLGNPLQHQVRRSTNINKCLDNKIWIQKQFLEDMHMPGVNTPHWPLFQNIFFQTTTKRRHYKPGYAQKRVVCAGYFFTIK